MAGMGDVFAELIGQDRAIAPLRRAVTGQQHAMTHAWLFVGPPGSGRSNAARAFAAALQCGSGGCGDCEDCRTSLSGAHPDVTLLRTEKLSISVAEVRDLVGRANVSPVKGRYQIVVVEDADRITERGADALLKGLEEPAPRTVWLLCAPSPDDVIVTVRSRCRTLKLVTPSDEAVSQLLVHRDGVSPELAEYAARAAQGHVGRARRLARSAEARQWRSQVLALPSKLTSITACLEAAAELVTAAGQEAALATAELDAKELEQLQAALGMGSKGAKPRNAQAAIKALEAEQALRVKRFERDTHDRVLTELTAYYRDVLALQTAPSVRLINADLATELAQVAQRTTPEQTVQALDAILAARTALAGNVAPQLALEALLLRLSLAARIAA